MRVAYVSMYVTSEKLNLEFRKMRLMRMLLGVNGWLKLIGGIVFSYIHGFSAVDRL